MTDGGAGTPEPGDGTPTRQPDAGEPGRLGKPTRLIPKRRPAAGPADGAPIPELVESETPIGTEGGLASEPQSRGVGGLGPWFAPRSVGGGRFQVWGCSPGCLIASIIGSVLLTLLLNALL